MWRIGGSIGTKVPLPWLLHQPPAQQLVKPLVSSSANGNHLQLLRHLRSKPTPSIQCTLNREAGSGASDINLSPSNQEKGVWSRWKLGLAAVLAYGLFDGVTYTSFFVIAFLGYEKSTGNNPAASLQALLGIVILMWTGNNVTRPFRVAGAAAVAPLIDRGLKRIQSYFNFPRLVYAFALVASMVAATCGTIVGLLILSRWGK